MVTKNTVRSDYSKELDFSEFPELKSLAINVDRHSYPNHITV